MDHTTARPVKNHALTMQGSRLQEQGRVTTATRPSPAADEVGNKDARAFFVPSPALVFLKDFMPRQVLRRALQS